MCVNQSVLYYCASVKRQSRKNPGNTLALGFSCNSNTSMHGCCIGMAWQSPFATDNDVHLHQSPLARSGYSIHTFSSN